MRVTRPTPRLPLGLTQSRRSDRLGSVEVDEKPPPDARTAGQERRQVSRQINVVEQLQEVRGHLAFGPPKTAMSFRRVSVPSIVIDEIEPHLVNRHPDATVFVAPGGGLVRLNQFRRRQWNPAVTAAGLGKDRVNHTLRYPAVALWIAGGATPNEIAKRTGHSSSAAVVFDRYGHPPPAPRTPLTSASSRWQ